MTENGTARPLVRSVDRALGLLDVLDSIGGEASLSALATASRLPVPTTYRLMATLVARGYARQLRSRAYALGPRLIDLGASAAHELDRITGPRLIELVEATGETANLARLDSTGVVYMTQVPSRHEVQTFTKVGRRVPAHATGVGKVLLAGLPDRDVRMLVAAAGLPSLTPRTITDAGRLRGELESVRKRGYAVDDQEQQIGVRCVAVALPGGDGRVAVSVSGSSTRFTPEQIERVHPVLRDVAQAIGADFRAKR